MMRTLLLCGILRARSAKRNSSYEGSAKQIDAEGSSRQQKQSRRFAPFHE